MPDGKRRMPHAQAGMAALLNVRGRTAKSIHQKIAEPLFGSLKVVRRTEPSQNVVLRNLPVERRDQKLKSHPRLQCNAPYAAR